MLNPFSSINWFPERRQIRSTAAIFAVGFTLIAAGGQLSGWWDTSVMFVVMAAALLIAAGAFALPNRLGLWFYRIWFAVGAAIGVVVGNLLFGILFFLLFSPFAAGLRIITRRDPLQLRRARMEHSGWRKTTPVDNVEEYFHQY